MRKIYATTLNAHDHNSYDGDYHYLAERESRVKMNLFKKPWYKGHMQFFETNFLPQLQSNTDVFAFTFTNGGLRPWGDPYDHYLHNWFTLDRWKEIRAYRPANLWDHILYDDGVYYCDHHQAHAAFTFISSGFDKADVLAIDGGGAVYRTMFFDSEGVARDFSKELPIGKIWNCASLATGVGETREGKVMGMAGYGKPDEDLIMYLELVTDTFDLALGGFEDKNYITQGILSITDDPLVIAASVQEWTNRQILEYIQPTSNKLAIAGGVSYNGYMNELLHQLYDEVYVCSSPGDEGQSVGVYMHADYVLNNNKHQPNAYMGKAYTIDKRWLEAQGITAG